jgi:hypothetical protein
MASGTPPATKTSRTFREDLDRLLTMLRRGAVYWKRSAAVFLVVALASTAYVMTGSRSYRSETVIQYQESIRSGDLVGGGDGANESARRVGARLKEMLMSRATLEPLITELKLYPSTMEARGLVDAVDEMRKHVAFRAREGDTFEISFESNSRELAQEVTKRLAEVIVQEASSRRSEQAKTLKEFLDAESDRNQIDLKIKEGALAKFLALHPDFAKPTTSDVHSAPATAPGAGATSGDAMLAALEWKAARIDRQLKAGAGGAVAPPPPKPRAAAPTKLPDSAELVAARKDLEDKAGRFTDKHPDVVAARNRLRTAEAAQAAAQVAADQAAAAAAAATDDDQPAIPATDANRDALTKQLADLKVQIAARRAGGATVAGSGKRVEAAAPTDNHGAAVDLEVEFRRLQREATEARDRQRQLDDKKFKASITASSVMNDRNIQVSVLDPAFLPTHPSSRPRSTSLGVGLLIGFILALGTALISARLDDRIHDRIDLEALDIMPILGVIPAPKALPRLPRKSG